MDPSPPRRGMHAGQGSPTPRRGSLNDSNIVSLDRRHHSISPQSPTGTGTSGLSPQYSPHSPGRSLGGRSSLHSPGAPTQSPVTQSYNTTPSRRTSNASRMGSLEQDRAESTFRENVEIRGGLPRRHSGSGSRRASHDGVRDGDVNAYRWGSPDQRTFADIDLKAKQLEQEYDDRMRPARPDSTELFPLRPGFLSRVGKEGGVYINYVHLKVPDVVIYRYHMDIRPKGASIPEPHGKKLKRIIQLLLTDNPELSSMCTDFRSLLYGPGDLFRGGESHLLRSVRYRIEEQDLPSPNANRFVIRIGSAGQPLSVTQFREYLERQFPLAENKPAFCQAWNSILSTYSHAQRNMMTLRGNTSHFMLDNNANNQLDLGRGMQVIRGFTKSVRPATGRWLANVNVTSVVVYKPLRLDVLARAYGLQIKPALEGFLKKLRVIVSYSKQERNNSGEIIPKYKTICGLARRDDGQGAGSTSRSSLQIKTFGGPKEVIFPIEVNGTKQRTSVWTHFTSLYGVELDENLPVVCTGTRRDPVHLPMEVCTVAPQQPCHETLTADERTKMIKFTCRRPEANMKSILEEGLPTLSLTDNILGRYNMSIAPGFIKAPAFVLPAPQLLYLSRRNPRQKLPLKPQNGSWNMGDIRFHSGVDLAKGTWACFWIRYPGRHAFTSRGGNPLSTIGNVVEELRRCGINIQQRSEVNAEVVLKRESPERHLEDCLENIEKIEAGLKNNFYGKEPLKLVYVILPNKNTMYYNAAKSLLDRDAGLHSSFMVADAFVKGGPQYYANVALKVNAKLGGIDHVIDSELNFLRAAPTMLCGLDVTHPSPGNHDQAPSIAAMVYSIDKKFAQWRSFVWLQDQEKREMVTDLKDKFKSAFSYWKKAHKLLP
ncbi:MAG: hypothetical protein Q9160_005930 [Pyrenula sp. 1 TL-2023]